MILETTRSWNLLHKNWINSVVNREYPNPQLKCPFILRTQTILLVEEKAIQMQCSINPPVYLDILSPSPFELYDLSIYIVHKSRVDVLIDMTSLDRLLGLDINSSFVYYAINSANNFPLMDDCGMYCISNSLYSISIWDRQSNYFGLPKIFLRW